MNVVIDKIFNYFVQKNHIKDAFKFMIIATMVSILILIGVMTKLGVILQQVLLFVGNGMESFLKIIAHYDSTSPGALSLLGTLVGALIGFLGVILVFVLQGNYQKNQDRKRLMYLLLSIYENISEFYYTSNDGEEFIKRIQIHQRNPDKSREQIRERIEKNNRLINFNKERIKNMKEEFEKNRKSSVNNLDSNESKLNLKVRENALRIQESHFIKELEEQNIKYLEDVCKSIESTYELMLRNYENLIVYDKDWRKLIVTINKVDESNFLRDFLLTLESGNIYNYNEISRELENLKAILNRYGFRKHVKYIDKKLSRRKEKINQVATAK